MRKCFLSSLAIVAAMFVGSSAFGQDYYDLTDSSVAPVSFLGGGGGGGCGGCDDKGCGDCGKGCDDGCGKGGCGVLSGLGGGCGGGGAYVDAELLMFRFNSGNGTIAGGAAANPTFANEGALRISLGYVGPGGMGIRFRYFDFSHDTGPFPAAVGQRQILVDTYNIDAELFEELEVGCATRVEWSAGVRYNDYRYRDINVVAAAPLINFEQERFAGWGLTFGLQATHDVGPGNIYGRARWALLQDENATGQNGFFVAPAALPAAVVAFDDMRLQTEIALGYEVSRCTNFGVVTARIGYEMQFWDGYNSTLFVNPRTGNVGFDGLVLGLELAR